MKTYLKVLICLGLSAIIVFAYPKVFKVIGDEAVDYTNETPVINQDVLSYSKDEQTYYKLYEDNILIGVVTNKEYFENSIKGIGSYSEEDYGDNDIGLKNNVYLIPEKTFNVFQNIDEQLVNYIIDHELYGIKAQSVEFSTNEGIYDIIYVKNADIFYEARDQFLINFISEETLNKLRNKEKINDLDGFGTIEKNAYIDETISLSESIVSPSNIFKTTEEVYEYLCYGRNSEREYYTIQEGDTLPGIGYFYGNLTAKQIVSLNKGVLTSTEQVLSPGTVINVKYFTSPITVIVTKDRLTQETITPDTPEYIRDESIDAGKIEVQQDEVVGMRNVLYQETWINGVLQSGSELSSKIVKEPVKGIIRIGIGATYQLGTGNFIFPTDNARISCGWGCYVMNGQPHNGTDIVNLYNPWGPVYAADSGTVETVSYDSISGNYVVINHNNDFKTYYGHLSAIYVSEGQAVDRGRQIGQIGMTGLATGPHIHFMIYVKEQVVNVCSEMDCSLIS